MRTGKKQRNGDNRLRPAYCDAEGNVYDYPGMEPAFRTGRSSVRIGESELIELPYGSELFSLPGRRPVFYDGKKRAFTPVASDSRGPIWGASAFLSSGYLRTYLPAFEREPDAPTLPLWAYTGLALRGDAFLAPALRVDDDPRSDPAIHDNDGELAVAITDITRRYRKNRLVGQLAHCAVDYRCLCARNFFLGRHEVPVPTTPPCNARCLGCLSRQEGTGFCGSQDRLSFMPAPEEIADVVVHHFKRVDAAVSSFGQGCEGEPLLRGKDLARAIGIIRDRTDRGTINLNTNGSLPEMAKLMIAAGLDSIRISLNSPTPRYYDRYYRPVEYRFEDVLRTMETALQAGIFVSINLFFLPGFTDCEREAESLFGFLEKFPAGMMQTRNLNIDPDYYLDNIGFEDSTPLGVRRLLVMLREKFPRMLIGYYNPPRERFSPEG